MCLDGPCRGQQFSGPVPLHVAKPCIAIEQYPCSHAGPCRSIGLEQRPHKRSVALSVNSSASWIYVSSEIDHKPNDAEISLENKT